MNKFSRWLFLICLLCHEYSISDAPDSSSNELMNSTGGKLKDQEDTGVEMPKSSEERTNSSQLPAMMEDQTDFMDFYFDNTDLIDIINQFAAKKGFNVIFPTTTQGGPITQKITFKNKKKLSIKEAEPLLYTFLEMSGYNLVPDQSIIHKTDNAHASRQSAFKVIKVDNNIAREPLPIFFNVLPQELPKSEKRIRAVYYLANLKVPDGGAQGGAQSPLDIMLKDMISPNGLYLFDPKANAVIIADKANVISSIMTIVNELDISGIRDIIEVVPLYHANAKTIADLLKNQQGLAIGGQRPGSKGDSAGYFSANIRIVADERTNTLVLMGRESAIERLKEFVTEYIDVPLESGKSILHHYDLQYLDAEKFAVDLQSIVSRQAEGSQSKQEFSGPESFFQGVIVKAEVPKVAEKVEAQVTGLKTSDEIVKGTVYKGGNRLIIAARAQDWARIRNLIQQLDTPQRQVILEVLIADITVEDTRILGAQTRNPSGIDLPNGVNFQAAQLYYPFTDVPPSTLAVDVLELNPPVVPPPPLTPPPAGSSLATILTGASPGSLIVSLNDPAGNGIWSVIQVLQQYNNTKVISHPFLVAQNNKEGHEVLSVIRRDFGDIGNATGTAAVINQVDVRADVKIAIVPRISSSERVSLQIRVDINQFSSATETNLQRNTRLIETNANLHTGQILVIGGLTNVTDDESSSETPILGRIPIFGWLFRSNTKDITKNNLVVFICPTVVEPRIREKQHYYTKRKVDEAYESETGNLIFDNLRDPITNFFFKDNIQENGEMVDNYIADARDTGLLVDRHAALNKNKRKIPSTGCKKRKKTMVDQNLKERLAHEENPLLRVKQ